MLSSLLLVLGVLNYVVKTQQYSSKVSRGGVTIDRGDNDNSIINCGSVVKILHKESNQCLEYNINNHEFAWIECDDSSKNKNENMFWQIFCCDQTMFECHTNNSISYFTYNTYLQIKHLKSQKC